MTSAPYLHKKMRIKYISQEEAPWIILGDLYELQHHNY